jgi:putative NIF3 family GTP cyclohydrolase 1 type 2
MEKLTVNLMVVLTVLNITIVSGQNLTSPASNTAAGIIAAIISNTGAATIPNTVDVIKEGDPETKITGIVTCMFATMKVLETAVAKNCNLIIVHEPLYYNHLDDKKRFQNDQVFLQKQKYITDHKLVIWRFHDYSHSIKPDAIETGMISKLGWERYAVKGSSDQFVFPETTLKEFLKSLKAVFPGNAFYVAGDPEMKFTRVSLSVGAPGSNAHISQLEKPETEVLLAGEAQQWETYEYARDAVDQGRKKAVIFLGHVTSEESGMSFCASWIKGFIKDIPVTFIACGPSYWSF